MTCQPQSYSTPLDESEVITLFQTASVKNEKVKVIGGGLSFSGVQLTEGHMISLEKMNEILKVEYKTDGALVTVQAGMIVREFAEALASLNPPQAMKNMGATASQSLAGATATSTHGTGMKIGSLATQIQALRIVDASGIVHVASKDVNSELFHAAVVGVGALGIITELTFKTVPLWKMRKTQFPYSLQKLFIDLPTLLSKYERLQWSFLPYTDNATVIVREDVAWTTPVAPKDSDPSDETDDSGCWSDSQATTPTCVDLSYKTLTDSLQHYNDRSLYTEMEMFVPVENTLQAVQEFILLMEDPVLKDLHNPSNYISVMIRYVAKDDILLSPMNGRDSSVLSFIIAGDTKQTGDPTEFSRYAHTLEALCQEKYQGRPHWGKVNYANNTYISKVYSDTYKTFQDMRMTMDPLQMFSNDYLEQRL